MSDLTADAERVMSKMRAPGRGMIRGAAQEVEIDYTNYRGERAVRRIKNPKLVYRKNQWHDKRCYMIEAFDIEKNDLRTFPLASIHHWREGVPSAAAPAQSEENGK